MKRGPLYSVYVVDEIGNFRTLEGIEKESIKLALMHFHGRVTKAADALGTSRNTLYRKCHKYNIEPQEYREDAYA